MNFRGISLTSNVTNVPGVRPMAIVLQRLFKPVVWAGLGLLGGATGVALAIALAIGLQSRLAPSVVFSPSASQLTVVAVVMGLGVSWLVSRLTNLTIPSLFQDRGEQGLQVIFVFSVFVSLVQTFLFFTHGL